MRNPSNNLIIGVLIAFGLGMFSLFLCQGAWLRMIAFLLRQSDSAALPASTTPVSAFSFPTATPPAPIGHELMVGNLGITVTKVIRPADSTVRDSHSFRTLQPNEQYLMVRVSVRCTATSESCRVTEIDFAVQTESGRDYPAEFSTSFSNLNDLLEGSEIDAGEDLSGYLVFIIRDEDRGLTMIYPRMFGFGSTAQFQLDP